MTTTLDEHHIIGPLGSDFWRIRVSPELVPAMAREFDWNRLGRRVMIDAREGIISWMNPSSTHEIFGTSADEIAKEAGLVLQKRVRGMRGTRWKGPDDPENVGLEADAAFYVGENADNWYAIREKGRQAVLDFEAITPPDLVVEVEVTNFDKDKPQRYASLGVSEMWRVSGERESDRFRVEILALEESGGPKVVEESLVLPGLPAKILPQAFEMAEFGRYESLRELIVENLLQTGIPEFAKGEMDPDSSPPSPSM
ncbi:MAG: Uma2 family endonuclease [Paracoccaceae bacterium]|nr:Uma2 family endonuclease [Paracoccaceae bacterium]